MRFCFTAMAFLLAFLLPVASRAGDAPFTGKYSDGKLTVDLSPAAGAYTGTFTFGNQAFPASAHAAGSGLEGTFTSAGNSFPFTASLDGGTMTLSTGGAIYALKPLPPAANPLARPEPANPLAGGTPADGNAPAGYTVEVATDFGKSLVTQKPNVASVKAALEATFPDLATYFGAKPTIGSAYQDAKDPRSGGATFGANLKGQSVRGFISCKLRDDASATVAVIYGRTDASKAEWDKLTSPPAQVAAAPPATAPADPGIPLHGYDFPDGTGSIGLADGWTTKAQTAIHTIVIMGPADQVVIVGNSQLVQTPDSQAVRMMQQNQATMEQMNARSQRMGLRPVQLPPVPPTLIAPLTGPVEALQNLAPQFSKRSEFNHGPSYVLDKIISSEDAPTNLPDAKCAVIMYASTRTLDGNALHFRTQLHLQTSPIAPGAWMWLATSRSAPDSTFDRDLPIMWAMCKSFKVNEARAKEVADAENAQMRQMSAQMAQQSQQALEANARQFQKDQAQRNANYQAQHAAQLEGYAQHNQQWKDYELQKSRNAADFIETIKGTRTVYDTRTGTAATADLNYVNGVVDSLNTAALDPNRYIQIPLRDELYPVPPAGK